METRANYVLIGVCTLIALIAGMVFLIWLAKWQSDRQYAYYDVLFENVSGLSRAAEVRFSGLTVGQVTSLDLAGNGTGQVRVRLQVDADTPVRRGTTAQLQAQGVTGLSFVSLTPPADQTLPLLRDVESGVPVIQGQRSVVQSLAEDAPDLLQQSIKLVKEFQNLLGGQNQAYVQNILGNVDKASGELETALADFSAISKSVAAATTEISVFTGKLDPIATSVDGALGEAKNTMTAMSSAFSQATTTLATADGTLKSVGSAADGADTLVRTEATAAVKAMEQAVIDLRSVVNGIGAETTTTLEGFGDTATLINARLTELEGTISALDKTLAGADTALASVDTAATGLSTLVDGDGTALVSEARTTLASVNRSVDAVEKAASQDLPAVMADVRRALVNVNTTIDTVSGDVTSFTGSLAPIVLKAGTALDAATSTFKAANSTLAQLEPAITVAVGAFSSANQVLSTDISPAATDLRASATRLSDAVEQMSKDLPGITSELMSTVSHANQAAEKVNTILADSAGPVSDFTAQGLPQFTRFTQEARDLVARLDRISAQLERDPARFFLGAQAPDFRR